MHSRLTRVLQLDILQLCTIGSREDEADGIGTGSAVLGNDDTLSTLVHDGVHFLSRLGFIPSHERERSTALDRINIVRFLRVKSLERIAVEVNHLERRVIRHLHVEVDGISTAGTVDRRHGNLVVTGHFRRISDGGILIQGATQRDVHMRDGIGTHRQSTPVLLHLRIEVDGLAGFVLQRSAVDGEGGKTVVGKSRYGERDIIRTRITVTGGYSKTRCTVDTTINRCYGLELVSRGPCDYRQLGRTNREVDGIVRLVGAEALERLSAYLYAGKRGILRFGSGENDLVNHLV